METVMAFNVLTSGLNRPPASLRMICFRPMMFMKNIEGAVVIRFLFQQMSVVACVSGIENNVKGRCFEDFEVTQINGF